MSPSNSTDPGHDGEISKVALATGMNKKRLARRASVQTASDEKDSDEKTAGRLEQVPDRLLHSVHEAQQLLHCSHAHIYRLLERGALHSVKVGNSRRITRKSIDDLAANGA
jgi:excisionase family DNA binding protein